MSKQRGVRSYQEHRNNWTQNSQESLLLELTKYSLGYRDLTPPVNFFSKVQVDGNGAMRYVPGNSRANFGSFVALIPAPLGIGSVTLDDGSTVKGFICEPAGLADAAEITRFGGWRRYLAQA